MFFVDTTYFFQAQIYDTSSVSSKQIHSVVSSTEQKITAHVATSISKPPVTNAGSTTVVELVPSERIGTNDNDDANFLSSLLSGRRQHAPGLPARDGDNMEKEKNTVRYSTTCVFLLSINGFQLFTLFGIVILLFKRELISYDLGCNSRNKWYRPG